MSQDVSKQFDTNVESNFEWPILWNLVQLLPVLWVLLLMLRPANRIRPVWFVVLGASMALGLMWGISATLGARYYYLRLADGNVYTYLLYVVSAWLLADLLAKRGRITRFILTLILLVFLALFGRICFEAGDIGPGLFSSEWARNLTGAGATMFGAIGARLLIWRKARQGRGRIAFFIWMFLMANVVANLALLYNAIEMAQRRGGINLLGIWQAWNIYCVSNLTRALCVTAILLVPMMLPLVSSVYRGRFDGLFGIRKAATTVDEG